MLRILTIAAFFSLLVSPAVSRAADAPAKSSGPGIMVRIQSVDQLLNNAEYIAGLVGQEETAKQVLGFVRALAGDKGIEGVDIKKPFVVYAYLAEEIVNSEAVLMAPIADKDAFMALLKTRLSLTVADEKNGLYSVETPNNSGTVYFRFENGYVYGTYLNKNNIDLKKLPKPADVVGKGDSLVSVSLRVDRLPEEMKKFALGSVETALSQGKDQPLPNATPALTALRDKAIDSLSAGIKSVLLEGEEITFKIDVDSKKDEIAIEFDLTAKKGSSLAKDIADWKTMKSVGFGGVGTGKPAILIGSNVSLPASVKKLLGPAVDDLAKMGLQMAPPQAVAILEPVVKAALPTFKSGDIDFATVLLGPDSDNKYTSLTVGKIAGGKDLEKAIKDAVKQLPPDAQDKIQIDADSVGEFKLHRLKVGDTLDDKAQKVIGKSDLWLAFRDDALIAAIGPKAKDAIAEALKSKPAAASIVKMEFSVARLIPLSEVQDEKASKAAAKAVFGKELTGDTFMLSVDGGDSLRVRAGLHGKIIKFAVLMDKAKKDN